MDDDIRKYDETFTDKLIPDITQNNLDEEDDIIKFVIQESINQFQKDNEYKKQLKKLEIEQKIKQEKINNIEIERTEQLKSDLGLIVSRLKTIFKDQSEAEDLLKWIEWECTPTHLLTEFRPNTRHSLLEIKKWIENNLNPLIIKKLYKLSFF